MFKRKHRGDVDSEGEPIPELEENMLTYAAYYNNK